MSYEGPMAQWDVVLYVCMLLILYTLKHTTLKKLGFNFFKKITRHCH
jgi:hypothetical protein